MLGYYCDDCCAHFEHPDRTDEYRWEEFWGERVRHHETTLQCPECGSIEVEEVDLCPKCREDRILDGYDWCFSCLPHEDEFQESVATQSPEELKSHLRVK